MPSKQPLVGSWIVKVLFWSTPGRIKRIGLKYNSFNQEEKICLQYPFRVEITRTCNCRTSCIRMRFAFPLLSSFRSDFQPCGTRRPPRTVSRQDVFAIRAVDNEPLIDSRSTVLFTLLPWKHVLLLRAEQKTAVGGSTRDGKAREGRVFFPARNRVRDI